MVEVGTRIRNMMPDWMTQRELAQRARLTPDALSRALNGQRGLSPIEVATIAKILGADTHWLITGTPDPLAVSIAARHTWDAQRRVRTNDGHQADQLILGQVVALYRAAYPHGPMASSELPGNPAALRNQLGVPFVRDFADVIEARLGVDVIRIPGLSTDYSIRVGGRGVIVLATQSAWFRSNWSLAHELAHLALNHHTDNDSHERVQRDEKAADSFAAALLIPAHELDGLAQLRDTPALARAVWDLGVSTEAIRNQLRKAKRPLVEPVALALAKTTPRLLRENVTALPDERGVDPVTVREQSASTRRFPVRVLSALQTQIDLGAASPEILAWALDVPVDDIDFPDFEEVSAADSYERTLAARPSAADWSKRISPDAP